MNCVLSIEGVLSNATGDVIQSGTFVYRALKSMGRVILVTEMSRTMAEGWLMINNVRDYDDLIDSGYQIDPDEELRSRQLDVVRAKGPVMLYVEADPKYAEMGLQKGLTTLLFSESIYSHLTFRPDRPKVARPWDEIVAERTRQQAMLATDDRANAKDFDTAGIWE